MTKGLTKELLFLEEHAPYAKTKTRRAVVLTINDLPVPCASERVADILLPTDLESSVLEHANFLSNIVLPTT